MCQHVLCLSLKAPPLSSLKAHKFLPYTFFLFSILISLRSSSYFTIPFHLQHITHQNSLLIFLSPSSTTTILSRMRSSSSLKQEFLKKWIWCLRKYSSDQKKNMNLLERKKAIKLSADVAMASTRNENIRWSRAIIANASRDDDSSPQQHQLQRERKTVMNSSSPLGNNRKIIRKVLRRKRRVQRGKERVVASFIAKRIVEKRTRRLKSLLPGGESMDDVSLVEETLDYIQSLRAQVEVMRCLVTASELLINPS